MLQNVMKIAIIGGGISGLSLAYKLRDLGHEIVIFEKNSILGGRIQTYADDDNLVDQGAEFYIENNVYLRRLIKELNLIEEDYLSSKALIDLKNSRSIILQKKNDSWFTGLKKTLTMVKKYGIKELSSLKKLTTIGEAAEREINVFYNIMENSDIENVFEKLKSYFAESGKLNLTGYDYLSELGISDNIIWNFVNPIVRNVYMTEIDKLPAYLVQLLLSLKDKGLYHVKGGNRILINALQEKLIDSNNVDIITNAKVNEIMLSPTEDFIIGTEINKNMEIYKDFDFIYISGPLVNIPKIKFSHFGSSVNETLKQISEIRYNQFYHHYAKVSFNDNRIDELISKGVDTIIPSDRISAIWELNIVKSEITHHYVDITSSYDLKTVKQNKLFTTFEIINSIAWKSAYPSYGVVDPNYFPNNHLFHSRIYFGTDNIISTMESSIIQANKCVDYLQTLEKIVI